MEIRKLLTTKSVRSLIVPSGIIFMAAFSRIIPHPPNLAPIAALSLFSGAKLDGKRSYFIPLAAMLLSDLFLGFHSTMPFVYGSFFVIVLLGKLIKRNENFKMLTTFSITSSVLFFLVTNFGVWLTSGMYVNNLNGLLNAYLMGLPFFKATIIGDFFYTISIFYGYKYLILFTEKLLFDFSLLKKE